MTYTNVFEKLINIINFSKNSWFNLVFLALVIICIVLLCKKKMSRKICFSTLLISYIILLILTINENYHQLSNTATNLIDNLFTNIYFPSTYTYLFVFIFMEISLVASFLKTKVERTIKTVNTVFFFIINFVFVLILQLISANKIDIFSKTSLFSNKNLVILLEFSINIFIFWLLALFVINSTNIITEKVLILKEKRNIKKESIKTSITNLEVNGLSLKEEYEPTDEVVNKIPQPSISTIKSDNNSSPRFIPTLVTNYSNRQLEIEKEYQNHKEINSSIPLVEPNFSYINPTTINYQSEIKTPISENIQSNVIHNTQTLESTFDLSSFIPKKATPNITNQVDKEQLFEKILKNELPVIKNEISNNLSSGITLENEKNTYTLNDYRIFNKILKEIREHNQNNTISIDKNLEYRLITKYSTETYNLFKKMLKNYSN